MVLKVFFLLATLALVSLPTCSATVQQQQQQQQQAEQQCVSKADFDSLVAQMATQTAAVKNLVTRIAAIENSHTTWRNATLNILRRYLPDNPALLLENIPNKLENIQSKMEQQQDKTNRLLDELATLRNTTMDALTDLHQIKQQQNKTDREMAALENTITDALTDLQQQIEQQQNKTDREMAALENTIMDGQANLQDKVATLQYKVDTFQNTTEVSTRKCYHEVVGLLQNMSCSLDGTEEQQKHLKNITEGLQDQLQSCNGTDISIQYLPTSCSEIAQMNPHSPPGYYKISTTSGAVYCTMITPDNPASSCQDIVVQHPRASSGYYWVKSTNGTAVRVYCSMITRNNPASSCQDIATRHPLESSGYYWVNSSNGTAVQVYCDMERHCCGSTGGWMRAAYLDMTDPTHHCPTGFRLASHSKRSCERITRPGCTGLTFAVQSVMYSKVCGKVIGYQYGSPDAFSTHLHYLNRTRMVDGNYVDGVSITHGHPRKHIWTFAAAADEHRSDRYRCPCSKTDTTYTGVVPPFLGSVYFCDTGSRNQWQARFYPDDPLWDGGGCGLTSSCCSFNSPPWFCKELPQPTTDGIEVRVCSDEVANNEDITIEQILLYLQ